MMFMPQAKFTYFWSHIPVFFCILYADMTHLQMGSGKVLERRFYISWDIKDESGVFQTVKAGKCKMGKRNTMNTHRNKSTQLC